MFKNPFYSGEFEWPKDSGDWYQGEHEPMLSPKKFDVVQRMLGNKGKPIRRSHEYDLTGLFRCKECNCAITASKHTKYYKETNNTATYIYYNCSARNRGIECSQKPISRDDFVQKIASNIGEIKPPKGFIEWAKKWLRVVHEDQVQTQGEVLQSQHRELEKTENMLNKLLDVYLQEGIDKEEYTLKKRELEKKQSSIEDEIENTRNGMGSWRREVEDSLDFAQAAQERFMNGDKDQMHSILLEISSELSYKDKKPLIYLKDFFQVLANQSLWEQQHASTFEPVEYADVKGKYRDYMPNNPIWLPGLDSNQQPTG